MPSPIAHSAVAYAIYRAFRRRPAPAFGGAWAGAELPVMLLAALALSMLPDLISLPWLLVGNFEAAHNNWEHSLFAAAGVALAVGGVMWGAGRGSFFTWLFVALLGYGLHVLMDWLTVGRGVMLFWPLSESRFSSPVKLFYGLHWSDGWWSTRHIWTVLSELGLVALAGLMLRIGLSRSRVSGGARFGRRRPASESGGDPC